MPACSFVSFRQACKRERIPVDRRVRRRRAGNPGGGDWEGQGNGRPGRCRRCEAGVTRWTAYGRLGPRRANRSSFTNGWRWQVGD